MESDNTTIHYTATEILEMASCRAATSVERMAHRWYLQPPVDGDGNPDMLLAPRFGRVPPLRIENPLAGGPSEVHVKGWAPYDWFNHLRVSCPGAPYPITVAHPLLGGRPSYEERARKAGPERVWHSYALTIPEGTPWVEISKTEEMEGCLVGVEFRPCPEPEVHTVQPEREGGPEVIGITDMGILASETLQAYDWQTVRDFFRQMSDMGFTHIFQQVYGGSASWSETARCVAPFEYGHMDYANWNEPGKRGDFHSDGATQALQNDLDTIRELGMKVTASFRINNEWLADWAMAYWGGKTPPSASQFSVDHSEFWMTYKSGMRSGGGLDFAFPEVREYRLTIIEEWCEKFGNFDGICIDVYRHPAMVSYPEDLVLAFKEKTGIDVRTVEPIDENTMIPEWLEFRAQPFTEFMRTVRQTVRERYGDSVQISARVANTFAQAMFDGCDLKAWFEEGLVDHLLLQTRPPANPIDADNRDVIEAAHAANVKVVHFLGGAMGTNFPGDDVSLVRAHLDRWKSWGTDGFGFYEAERVARDGRWLHDLPEIINTW